MKIQSANNFNINFSSKSPQVKQADDIQRRARKEFPVLSSSYMDSFYKTTQVKDGIVQNFPARNIFKKVDHLITHIRETVNGREHDKEIEDRNKEDIPYFLTVEGMKKYKAGNCHECALGVMTTLAANGYYNSEPCLLGLDVQIIDKKTGYKVYETTEEFDHEFVLALFNEENPTQKDIVVLDSWLGFADNLSGAKDRYSTFIKDSDYQKKLDKVTKHFKSNMEARLKREIDLNNFEIRSSFSFVPQQEYETEELVKLGDYARKRFPNLVVKNNQE